MTGFGRDGARSRNDRDGALLRNGRDGARPLQKISVLLLVVVMVVVVVGCGGGGGVTRPELHLGEDECSFCRMIVSEERHASVVRDARGGELRFDDLGCLAAYHREHADSLPWSVWLHTSDAGWVSGEQAWIARVPDLRTPMGSGLAAFASRDAAARAGEDVVNLEGLFQRAP